MLEDSKTRDSGQILDNGDRTLSKGLEGLSGLVTEEND